MSAISRTLGEQNRSFLQRGRGGLCRYNERNRIADLVISFLQEDLLLAHPKGGIPQCLSTRFRYGSHCAGSGGYTRDGRERALSMSEIAPGIRTHST